MAKAPKNNIALLKLERYCAWQERCEAEVIAKMELLKIPISKQSVLLKHLRNGNYLNDTRYAQQFSIGKFRMKKWGRNKISAELTAKGISDKIIDDALNKLDSKEYEATLIKLMEAKHKNLIKIEDPYQLNHKVSVYAIAKGYEPELVWDFLRVMGNER